MNVFADTKHLKYHQTQYVFVHISLQLQKRLKNLIQENIGENEINQDLMNEVKIREEEVADKDVEIAKIQQEKRQVEAQKKELHDLIDNLKM